MQTGDKTNQASETAAATKGNIMENNTSAGVTTHRKGRNWFLEILGFPFKLIGILFKYTFILVLILSLTVLGYCLVSSTRPMAFPEAGGMSYQAFMRDRVAGIRDIPDHKDACFKSAFILLPFYVFRTSGIPAMIAVLSPGGEVDLWLQQTDPNYSFLLPRGNPRWGNLLSLFWETIERSSWVFLVRGVEGSRTCSAVRPVSIQSPPGR
jgi:hypothetical protein